MRDNGFIHLPNMSSSGQAEMLLLCLGHRAVVGVQDRTWLRWGCRQERRHETLRAGAAAPATAACGVLHPQCTHKELQYSLSS